jgi:hypothetical protein
MPNENELTDFSDELRFYAAVLESALCGNETFSAITKHLGLNVELDGPRLRRLLNDGKFWADVEKTKLKVDERVIQWLKGRGLKYARKMDALTENSDPRVAFQATKDALDRIGTAPTQKVATSNLDQYKALIDELKTDKEK